MRSCNEEREWPSSLFILAAIENCNSRCMFNPCQLDSINTRWAAEPVPVPVHIVLTAYGALREYISRPCQSIFSSIPMSWRDAYFTGFTLRQIVWLIRSEWHPPSHFRRAWGCIARRYWQGGWLSWWAFPYLLNSATCLNAIRKS